MARRILLAALVAGTVLVLPCTAQATLVSSTCITFNISSQFAGQSGYDGLHTYAIFVLFSNPGDRLVLHGFWDFSGNGSGCFVNADPVADDPLGLIDDATGGNVPIAPGIISQRGYGAWAWDTNLSLDNSPLSVADPSTQMSETHIQGGAWVEPPVVALAGPDQMVQVAQVTLSTLHTGGCGTMTIAYLNAGSTVVHISEINVMTSLSDCGYSPFDLSGDFSVDTLDLGILLSNWSIPDESPACGGDPCCRSDLNHDGFVNSLDLGILLSQWDEIS